MIDYSHAGKTDAQGRVALQGIPYIPNATLNVFLHDDDRYYQVRLQRRHMFERLRRARRARNRGESSVEHEVVDEAFGEGVLQVEVRSDDRLVAGGVPIAVRVGNRTRRLLSHAQSGVALFDNLPFADVRVVACDPLYAYEERHVKIHDGIASKLTLGPGSGRILNFVVTGGTQRLGVAGARIRAKSWFGVVSPPLIHGVQHCSVITGAEGVATWQGFPTGQVAVTATRGHELVHGTVQEGGRTDRESLFLRPVKRRR